MMYDTHIEIAKGTATTSILAGMLMGTLPSSVSTHLANLPTLVLSGGLLYLSICWGSEYPDTDLVTSKASNRNPINKLIARYNGAFHIQHRSWKTHSIDLALIRCCVLYTCIILLLKRFELLYIGNLNLLWLIMELEKIALVICTGLFIGNVCHIFADFFTQEGAYIFCFLRKFRLVPAYLGWGNYRPFKKFFSTGDDSVWETFIRKYAKLYFKATLVLIPIVALIPIDMLLR